MRSIPKLSDNFELDIVANRNQFAFPHKTHAPTLAKAIANICYRAGQGANFRTKAARDWLRLDPTFKLSVSGLYLKSVVSHLSSVENRSFDQNKKLLELTQLSLGVDNSKHDRSMTTLGL